MLLSGPLWVQQFPTSSSVDDLAEPFRTKVRAFLAALSDSGATVRIADTLRPPQRVYLMYWSFAISKNSQNPAKVPLMDGVDIQWMHTDSGGNPDPTASVSAAAQMVEGYEIVFKPALTSRHTQGLAIDMAISWQGNLAIRNAAGEPVAISSSPRNGSNSDLWNVGATYGVIKLATDPPHWSSDGD